MHKSTTHEGMGTHINSTLDGTKFVCTEVWQEKDALHICLDVFLPKKLSKKCDREWHSILYLEPFRNLVSIMLHTGGHLGILSLQDGA
jgi:hypothetical protein